jgi:hypothetical protein
MTMAAYSHAYGQTVNTMPARAMPTLDELLDSLSTKPAPATSAVPSTFTVAPASTTNDVSHRPALSSEPSLSTLLIDSLKKYHQCFCFTFFTVHISTHFNFRKFLSIPIAIFHLLQVFIHP